MTASLTHKKPGERLDSLCGAEKWKLTHKHTMADNVNDNERSRSDSEERRSPSLANGHSEDRYTASVPVQPEDREAIARRVLQAFENPKEWRSAWGISHYVPYSIAVVRETLASHPEYFEVSPIAPGGIALYRPRTRR